MVPYRATENEHRGPNGAWTPRHLDVFATLLDTVFKIPGTRFRFGLDPVLGLIPGVGDLLSGFLSGYVLLVAAREGVPKVILLRMLANVGIDTLFGSIPLLGDLFDVWWKANTRNLQLLQRHRSQPSSTRRASTAFVILLLTAAALLVTGTVLLLAALLRALMDLAA